MADTGYFVIRYSNRDVGRSTTYESGQPGYTFEDMADDAVRVLDAYMIQQAHIVGMSKGGMLTQNDSSAASGESSSHYPPPLR